MAAIYAYLSAVWAGSENPLWLHLVLIPVSVVAAVAVGIAIVLERPTYSATVHRFAFWLIVTGIAVESLCTVTLFVVDERITAGQQRTIIALETKLAPRTLDPEQQKELERLIANFAGQEFQGMVAPSVDGLPLWYSLNGALEKAHWKFVPPATNTLTVGKPPAGIPIFAAPDVDVWVPRGSKQTVVAAANSLVAGLRAVGVWAVAHWNPNNGKDASKTLLLIRIGAKSQ